LTKPSLCNIFNEIIPLEPFDNEKVLKERLVESELSNLNKILNEKQITRSRVVISVDPTAGVCLSGLGRKLEIAETEKEDSIFKENAELKEKLRNRGNPRYINEEWCKTEDPWYDGRGHDYTIIDVPKVNSLLTFEEIVDISLSFTESVIEKSLLRYVFPFHFNEGKYLESKEK